MAIIDIVDNQLTDLAQANDDDRLVPSPGDDDLFAVIRHRVEHFRVPGPRLCVTHRPHANLLYRKTNVGDHRTSTAIARMP